MKKLIKETIFYKKFTSRIYALLHSQEVTEKEVNCIEIPNGATNGDMIEAMFPNCEQKEHMHNGYFEMYFDGDLGNASYMRVSKDWWRAKYRIDEESEDKK